MRAVGPVGLTLTLLACGSGPAWVRGEPSASSQARPPEGGWVEALEAPASETDPRETEPLSIREEPSEDGETTVIRLEGGGGDVFRNTYYDFPREGEGPRESTVFDAKCAPIAAVTTAFHDAVCVQGSGRLASGATVSFARRDCACAALCPRTGQRICFEQLDPARFPAGRGATGRAITPLRTVAVDTKVIPLGTRLFVRELVGLPLPDGTPHDGCFVAEDRGLKVVGRQIDIFTGDPAMTARWNALRPSNTGVHVELGSPRCAAR
jgi:3D (Asp-Asp-Asp) domain-containing protein